MAVAFASALPLRRCLPTLTPRRQTPHLRYRIAGVCRKPDPGCAGTCECFESDDPDACTASQKSARPRRRERARVRSESVNSIEMAPDLTRFAWTGILQKFAFAALSGSRTTQLLSGGRNLPLHRQGSTTCHKLEPLMCFPRDYVAPVFSSKFLRIQLERVPVCFTWSLAILAKVIPWAASRAQRSSCRPRSERHKIGSAMSLPACAMGPDRIIMVGVSLS